MLVLDTHAWLWRSTDPKRLSSTVRRLAAQTSLAVSAVTVWEVALLVQRGRITLDRPVDRWVNDAARDLTVLPLDGAVALRAAHLRGEGLDGDPADAFIYATALLAGGRLATKDARLRAFDPRLTVW